MRRSLTLALAAAAVASAAYCGGSPDPNAQPNTYPINTQQPTLLSQGPNGKVFKAGQPGFDFYVVHLYGTPYQMGFAHGSMLKPQVQEMANRTWNYMVEQVTENLTFLPAWLADLIATAGLDVALDVLIDLTKPMTGDYFYEELQGLADGAEIDYKTICRIHLIGELTQGDCSMFGAWGEATAGNKTLGLRALDWDTDGPFKDYPAVVVYHPTSGGHAFANVGFLGWIGALTGQSSAKLSIHEIGVSFPDDVYFGNESFAGTPFVYMLRDMLQFDNSYTDVIKRLTNSNRTCDLILGTTDGNANTARSFAVSASQLEVFDDTNLQPWNNTPTTWHPRFTNIVYHAMDWLCPGYSIPMSHQLSKLYGTLSVENTISDVTAIVQTGDVHLAVYDLTDNKMAVSFMAPTNATIPKPEMAYDRQFTLLDLGALFSEPAPQLDAPAVADA